MYQNEIVYFWPLTEQIDLGLDFAPCAEYEDEKRRQYFANSITCNPDGNLLVGTSISNTLVNPTISFTAAGEERMRFTHEGIMMMSGGAKTKAGFWAINDNNFRIYRDKKPSWIACKATRAVFGWKWNDEC